jgi:acyl-CoA synthetase (AMP-forming)/AMP-acid ligase II
VTFVDILRKRADEQADQTAFVFIDGDGRETERLTFGLLYLRSRHVARNLVSQGLSGRRVILALPSGLDFVVALFGCFCAGAIAIPIPGTAGRRTANRVDAIFSDAAPAAVLTLKRLGNAPEINKIAEENEISVVWLYLDMLPVVDHCRPLVDVRADSLAIIQYTSGSTSAPKGVMLSHDNLLANNAMIARTFGHDASSRGVTWLPLFHDMGLVGHLLQSVYVGGLSVLMSPLVFLQRPLRWLKAISDWKATTSGGPSYAYELCLRALTRSKPQGLDLSSWKIAYCGAEPIRADVLKRFAQAFAPMGFREQSFLPCYGLAEATLLVTGAKRPDGLRFSTQIGSSSKRQWVSCGPPPDGSVVIVDPSGSRLLSEGEVGEIRVSGASVARGYWQRDSETQQTFFDGLGSAERSLRTGDLGFLSEGDLFVTGRIKDVIISLGSNHTAEDIEATVYQCDTVFSALPCAAFAFEVADGERAVVIQEVSLNSTDSDHLARAVETAFAAITREHGLRLFDFMLVKAGSLPRTSSGKVRRTRTRELYEQQGFVRLNNTGTVTAGRRSGDLANALDC